MFAGQGDQSLCKTDEADAEGTVIDNRLDGVVFTKLFTIKPQRTHQERELLLEGSLLEVESLVKLLGCNIHGVAELVEELVDPVFAVVDAHALDGKFHYVDCGEGEVASTD